LISNNQIFNYISVNLPSTGETIYITGKREAAPPSLPCVYVLCIDESSPKSGNTLTMDDSQRVVSYEVQAFSTELTEANSLTDRVSTLFKAKGFRQTYRSIIDNADSRVMRVVSRYTRLIGGGDTL